jgi:hypothetical protein
MCYYNINTLRKHSLPTLQRPISEYYLGKFHQITLRIIWNYLPLCHQHSYSAFNVKAQVVNIVTTYSSFTVTHSIAADILASTYKEHHTAKRIDSGTSTVHTFSGCNSSIAYLSFYWQAVKQVRYSGHFV